MDLTVSRREPPRPFTKDDRYRVTDEDSGEEYVMWRGQIFRVQPGKEPSCPLTHTR